MQTADRNAVCQIMSFLYLFINCIFFPMILYMYTDPDQEQILPEVFGTNAKKKKSIFFLLILKALITTAADDIHKYFVMVFQRK